MPSGIPGAYFPEPFVSRCYLSMGLRQRRPEKPIAVQSSSSPLRIATRMILTIAGMLACFLMGRMARKTPVNSSSEPTVPMEVAPQFQVGDGGPIRTNPHFGVYTKTGPGGGTGFWVDSTLYDTVNIATPVSINLRLAYQNPNL